MKLIDYSTVVLPVLLFNLGASSMQPSQVNDINSAASLGASCDAGDALACTQLGVRYREGDGVSQSLTLANRLLARGCDGGDKSGCSELAEAYYRGNGVRVNYVLASRLADRSCTLGDAQASVRKACEYKATMYANGHGILQDYGQSFAYREQACAMGGQTSCVVVAKSLRVGSVDGSRGAAPLQKDLVRAKQLGDAACIANLSQGCMESASVSLAQGRMADYGASLSAACDRNRGDACFTLTKALDNGRVASNVTGLRSLESYRGQACRLNIKAACVYKSRVVLAREAREKEERDRLAAIRAAEKKKIDDANAQRVADARRRLLKDIFGSSSNGSSSSQRGQTNANTSNQSRSSSSSSKTYRYVCHVACRGKWAKTATYVDFSISFENRATSMSEAKRLTRSEAWPACRRKFRENGMNLISGTGTAKLRYCDAKLF